MVVGGCMAGGWRPGVAGTVRESRRECGRLGDLSLTHSFPSLTLPPSRTHSFPLTHVLFPPHSLTHSPSLIHSFPLIHSLSPPHSLTHSFPLTPTLSNSLCTPSHFSTPLTPPCLGIGRHAGPLGPRPPPDPQPYVAMPCILCGYAVYPMWLCRVSYVAMPCILCGYAVYPMWLYCKMRLIGCVTCLRPATYRCHPPTTAWSLVSTATASARFPHDEPAGLVPSATACYCLMVVATACQMLHTAPAPAPAPAPACSYVAGMWASLGVLCYCLLLPDVHCSFPCLQLRGGHVDLPWCPHGRAGLRNHVDAGATHQPNLRPAIPQACPYRP